MYYVIGRMHSRPTVVSLSRAMCDVLLFTCTVRDIGALKINPLFKVQHQTTVSNLKRLKRNKECYFRLVNRLDQIKA